MKNKLPFISLFILICIFILLPRYSSDQKLDFNYRKTRTPHKLDRQDILLTEDDDLQILEIKTVDQQQNEDGLIISKNGERFYGFLTPKDLQSNYDSQVSDN